MVSYLKANPEIHLKYQKLVEEDIKEEAISRGHDPEVYLYIARKLADKIRAKCDD